MSNLLNLTSAQLIKAANIKDRIEALTKELNGLLGSSAPRRASGGGNPASVKVCRCFTSPARRLKWAATGRHQPGYR